MKKESRKIVEIEELKMKMDKDFYKEVINAKYENVILTEYVEFMEKENKILAEEPNILKKSRKSYVIKVVSPTNTKDDNEEEQELI